MSIKDGRVKVLFVCVGNACRSPMAEAIACVDAPDAIEAFSAGLSPIGSVTGMTKQTLMRNGYWVSGLEPKSLSTDVWEQADIVINLSGRPREHAFRENSNVEDWEIEDPFGKDIEVYQQVFEEIRLRVAELARVCRRSIAAARSAERRAREQLTPSFPPFVLPPEPQDQGNPGGLRRRWGLFTAFGVLIGLVSLIFEWGTMPRDVQTEMSATLAQKTGVSNQEVQGQPLPPNGQIAMDRSLVDAMDTQVPSAAPLFAKARENVPDPSLEDVVRQALAVQRRSANTIVKTPSRPTKSELARGRATYEPAFTTASVNRRVVAEAQPLPVGIPSATSAQPEIQIAPPVISTSNLPADFPPVALREIRSPAPPPRQPAVSTSMTAAVAIVADAYPSIRVPDGGLSNKQGQATSLQLGHLLSRVEPIYPEAAKQQGIQGTVKLHAIIGRQGSVQNLEPLDGSPVLVAAAVYAVRQWRYTETLLAGRSVETEENIAITFRLSNPTPPTN